MSVNLSQEQIDAMMNASSEPHDVQTKEERHHMTKEELAKILDGREYCREITRQEAKDARDAGLVVVYGASDDLMEFDGAIYDEAGCYEGGVAYLSKGGPFVHECDDDDCPHAAREREKCAKIKAVWCGGDGDASWTYETNIPHATFNIYEDGELYCVGIVFELAELGDERSGEDG